MSGDDDGWDDPLVQIVGGWDQETTDTGIPAGIKKTHKIGFFNHN